MKGRGSLESPHDLTGHRHWGQLHHYLYDDGRCKTKCEFRWVVTVGDSSGEAWHLKINEMDVSNMNVHVCVCGAELWGLSAWEQRWPGESSGMEVWLEWCQSSRRGSLLKTEENAHSIEHISSVIQFGLRCSWINDPAHTTVHTSLVHFSLHSLKSKPSIKQNYA